MSRRSLWVSLVLMIGLSVVAVIGPLASNTSPTLGLDLQGGFSVVLQAKEVNGELPTEESVEKAKDIIRERVDGLGVAEPDITRQGRTVVVQLPGVRNRERAESVVGCTAKLEFRPVLAVTANPNAATGSTTTTAPGATTTTAAGATTTTAAGATTTTAAGSGTTLEPSTDTTAAATTETTTGGGGDEENGMGAVGVAPGEGALPGQFAPTTTTTIPPTTTSTAPPATTSTTPSATTTTVAGATTTTTVGEGGTTDEGNAGCAGTGQEQIDPALFGASGAAGGEAFPSQDGELAYLLGPVGFDGAALESATANIPQGAWLVSVKVKDSQVAVANAAFNQCYSGGATCPAQSQQGQGSIAIVLDGEVVSAPTVNGADLASDEFTISGDFSESEAKDLALVLRYGSLPVEFEQAALQQVSATLGEDSLRAGLIAGLIGIGALALYMVLYYRGFGAVVVVSLLVWAALMYGLICLLSEQQGLALTLAGITGIIVSVGTTVDTYVVVFERVKDLIREGKSVRAATEAGYRSGIRTVLTANGAAFIGAFLLWWLTIGPVRGFAYFLGISVILDLFVAILFTRPLVLLLSRSPRFAKSRFFGIATATDASATAKGAVT